MRAAADAGDPAAEQASAMNRNPTTTMQDPYHHQIQRRPAPTRDWRAALIGLCLCVTAGAGVAAANATDTIHSRIATSVSSRSAINVTVSSPTHKPKVNVPWPVKVTVTGAKGKPVAATLTMEVLFGGQPVGKIDNGAVYHFVGTWQERKGNEITWPAASKGEPLTLEFIVKAQGVTVRKTWAITVS